ncbi:conserved hypothetical protein [Histoplasma capsulatum var. duboisii H88]|uniref:PAS domain-containing protein n=1 Tax=Ajellomyces capsulatus (strain H88) TaxID=544711 RepID=F0URP9_AJEC8|nr:conserved hypothetical protein [Histoplasma capsulatum var. duboisii H88]
MTKYLSVTSGHLTPAARVKYTSASVQDILGYTNNEVVGMSLWDFVHPLEFSFAKQIHTQSIRHDIAAGLSYFQIKHKLGHWVGVECVFNVVYDVLVASTSIYQRGLRSQKRATDAPAVRRLFWSPSQFDPRYSMLSYISSKFSPVPQILSHEPRAALFLNRFTRSSNIMYATSGVARVLGLRPADLVGRSFYYCIEECSLHEAVRCIEGVKSNDTISYLRFWFRNPLLGENSADDHAEYGSEHKVQEEEQGDDNDVEMRDETCVDSRNILNNCNITDNNTNFSRSLGDIQTTTTNSNSNNHLHRPRIEIEAVISCSSDGLVVVLRHARPVIPPSLENISYYSAYLPASPWDTDSTIPVQQADSSEPPESIPSSLRGPEQGELMDTIRDVAFLAWAPGVK